MKALTRVIEETDVRHDLSRMAKILAYPNGKKVMYVYINNNEKTTLSRYNMS